MAAPKKYSDELQERATRMVLEARRDPTMKVGALARIGGQLGVDPEALRNWVKQAEIDGGVRAGTTTVMRSGWSSSSRRSASCGGRTRS